MQLSRSTDDPAGATPGDDTPVIQLTGAAFGYADRPVVSDVDLTIRRGEVVALLGPNGAGKSTLVKGLLGLADRHAGTASVLGRPAGTREARARLGYVPQRHTLASAVRATATEIVTMGRTVRTPWWAPWRTRSPHDRALVADALGVVGLGDRGGDDVATLSGGQQRRVLIARALASEPDVVLMDEPMAGVDVGHQQVLVAVMRRLVERGATLVIVTHELEALADIATRAVVVRAGGISQDGPAEAIVHLGEHGGHGGHGQHGEHAHHEEEDEPEPSPVQVTMLGTQEGPQ